MLLKIMSNRLVLKMMSNRVMIKIITAEMKAFMWLMSPFSSKKKEGQADQSHPSDSGKSA